MFAKINSSGVFIYKDKELTILHNPHGPAVIHANGDQIWYLNNKLHNPNGPAAIYVETETRCASQEWYLNNKSHNLNGPAFIASNGIKSWYINNQSYSEEAFNKRIKKLNNKKMKNIDLKSLAGRVSNLKSLRKDSKSWSDEDLNECNSVIRIILNDVEEKNWRSFIEMISYDAITHPLLDDIRFDDDSKSDWKVFTDKLMSYLGIAKTARVKNLLGKSFDHVKSVLVAEGRSIDKSYNKPTMFPAHEITNVICDNNDIVIGIEYN